MFKRVWQLELKAPGGSALVGRGEENEAAEAHGQEGKAWRAPRPVYQKGSPLSTDLESAQAGEAPDI